MRSSSEASESLRAMRAGPAGLLALLLALPAAHAAEPPAGTQPSGAPPSGTAQYRPELHFTPERNWMNDPNGLVYLDGTYHLFFQHNPYGDRWGHMSWGHAVSRDLLHWQELPVAIPETRAWMIFSGSIVQDRANSSGLGADGIPPLVAIYTAHGQDGEHLQRQALASSLDGGRTWTQYPGNPVLDLHLTAFRDPKVFWHEPTHQWVMVAALSDLHQVTFYGSPDLRQWQHLSDFGPAGATDGAWECPDLFVLPVEDTPGESRWVLKVDVGGSRTLEGSGAQYFVGHFDGQGFVPDAGQPPQEADFGRDFYAAASWSYLPEEPPRRVWIGWMANPGYAQKTPTSPWRGAMSLPRELSLRRSGGLLLLAQVPVRELRAARSNQHRLKSVTLRAGGDVDLGPLPGASEVEATLDVGTAREAGLVIRRGRDEETIAGYDARARELFVDRTRSGRTDFDPGFATRQHTPLTLHEGLLRLDIVQDRSSIEIFAENGLKVLTLLVFPSQPDARLHAYAMGGKAAVVGGTSWDLAAGASRTAVASVGTRR